MAMEDAIALAVAADAADGDSQAAFQSYQALRLVRASRVQISSRMLGCSTTRTVCPGGCATNIYRAGRRALLRCAGLDFSAPDYVQRFR